MAETPNKEDPQPQPPPPPSTKAFSFWAYFTITISLLTLLFLLLNPSHGPTTTTTTTTAAALLPDQLRRHYSTGQLLKTHPINLFVSDAGDPLSEEPVILLHGLGSSSFSFRRILPLLANAGLRAIAIDLPGSGFSDKPTDEDGVFAQIRNNGIFSAFERLVETGEIPSPDQLSAEEMLGQAVGKVFDEMSITSPVHLVLHDSALVVLANWVSVNARQVRSITLVDTPVKEPPAFPFQFLQVPVVGSLLLKSEFLFSGLLRLCCSRSVGGADAEAYRVLIGADGGKRSVVELGKGLNRSFDLGDWAKLEAVKGMAIQVLWSSMWSDRWIKEGRQVAAAIPQAKFAWHSGGRWPQEDNAEEIAGMIVQFVSSRPKSIRKIKEDHGQDHTEKKSNDDNYSHGHGHGYDYGHAADYVGMYGRGQEWGY